MVRILMYIVVIVIGIVSIVVGATMDPAAASATPRELFIGLGIGIVLVGIYAWILGIGPIEPERGPGFRFDFWPDGVVILALLIVSAGVSALVI